MWQEEQPALRPLPQHPYDCCRLVNVRLNRYSQIQVETNRYSVPTDASQSHMIAKLYPFTVEIYAANEPEPVAIHQRSYDRQQEIIDPLHYLPLIRQRPGAFDHAKPIRRWREQWPVVYEQLLAHLQQKWPDGRGIREFVQILYLHRDYPADQIETAITMALAHHCAHLDGVQLWLTQLQRPETTFPTLDLSHQPQLTDVGQQPVQTALYDSLVGGQP